jgi:hypothetical protein
MANAPIEPGLHQPMVGLDLDLVGEERGQRPLREVPDPEPAGDEHGPCNQPEWLLPGQAPKRREAHRDRNAVADRDADVQKNQAPPIRRGRRAVPSLALLDLVVCLDTEPGIGEDDHQELVHQVTQHDAATQPCRARVLSP